MKYSKTFYPLSVAILILLFSASAVNAGDYAMLNVIGFSKDGKFMAFEEYGTQDGSGYPYVNIYFINVEKNSYASAPYKLVVDNENTTETVARNKAKLAIDKKLKELKIIRGNAGKPVISRLLTDLSDMRSDPESGKPIERNFAEEVGSFYKRGDYTLKLTPTEAVPSKECEGFGYPIFKFELTLHNNETNKTKILQKNNDVPKSRYCPTDYSIQHVYLYERKLVVFVSVYSPGFEGPDMRFIAVTGELD